MVEPVDRRREGLPTLHRELSERAAGGSGVLDATQLQEALADPLLSRLERHVDRDPWRIAVKSERATLTYDALNRAANRLAHVLLVRLGSGNEPVPFLLERGAAPIVAILGILKAGKIYACIEPSNPVQRIKFILADTQAHVLVTNNENLALARQVAAGEQDIVNLDDLVPGVPDGNPGLSFPTDTPSTLFYTSGSTGQPKAVIHTHGSLLRNALVRGMSMSVNAEDRQAIPFAYSFTWPTSHTFASLTVGARVYPDNFTRLGAAELSAWLASERITMLHMTPSLLRRFLQSLPEEYGERFPSIRVVICSGEPLFPQDVERWQRHFGPECRLAFGYGASEASGIAMNVIARDTKIDGDCVPVGHPRPGYEVLILDDEENPLGAGRVGQIAIRGAFVSPGYWRRPELTGAAFRPDPQDPSKRIYLTGDLGRLLPDGQLEHLGRRDSQVKIRGYRVQLGEVEVGLFATGVARQVAVAAKEDARGEKRLVAYVVPGVEPRPSVERLRGMLAKSLPDYMIPSAFVFLDSMPLNANGKVDRHNLPEPDTCRPELDSAYVAPRDEIELRLLRIWEELLCRSGLGVDDDFFALGGHSLLAASLLARLEQEFGRQISLTSVLGGPTIAQLARVLRGDQADRPWTSLLILHAGGNKPPLFWCHGKEGWPFWYEQVIPCLDDDQPVFGIVFSGLDGRQPIHARIEAMAAHYVREICTVQPLGPYHVCGPSASGGFALEVAHQLHAAGKDVDLLALFDSPWPGFSRPFTPPAKGFSWSQSIAWLGARRVLRHLQKQAVQWLKLWLLTRAKIAGYEIARRLGLARRLAYGRWLIALAQDAALLAWIRYLPPAYPGKATLFVSLGQRELEGPDLPPQWRRFVSGELEVIEVQGNHSTMLAPPHVQVLAQHLRQRLPRAETAAPDGEGG